MVQDTALLAGATGLIGGHCLRTLLDGGRYQRVIALTRRPSGTRHSRLLERIVDFEKLDEIDPFPLADIFCALGTTLRRAGSQPAFLKVDFEYPGILARRSAAAGGRQFTLVSSVGADIASGNFYLRVKGEVENAISELPFESIHIFRPSFLIGERVESRWGESAGIAAARALQFALTGKLRKYRPISAATVASAMAAASVRANPGRHIYYDDIVALAGRV
jgi:uncharacterized protein YbjT (DUF2867 family)